MDSQIIDAVATHVIHPIVKACVLPITPNSVVPNSVIANVIDGNTLADQTTAIATGVDVSLIGMAHHITYMAGFLGPMISIGLFGQYFVSGEMLPVWLAYGGLMMVMVMSMLSTAYAIVKIVDATNKWTGVSSFYYGYHSRSDLGNYIGAFELVNVLTFLTWTLLGLILGMYVGFTLWTRYDEDLKENRLTLLAGFKYYLLSFVAAAGIWIAGLNVGDVSSSTLGFFDTYNTKQEAIDINDYRYQDQYGVSFFVDLGIHLTETYFELTVVSSLIIYAIATILTWIEA